MKLLLSWLATNNAFIREDGVLKGVRKDGPNFNMHHLFYNYDRHIILYSDKRAEIGAERLMNVKKKKVKVGNKLCIKNLGRGVWILF